MNISKIKDVWKRFGERGMYPHQLAFLLLVPIRRIVLSPDKLVQHLDLIPTFRVLEVGPGPGFFSIAVAQSMSKGRLELVDVQLEMLQKARRRLRRARADNVGYTQATAIRLPFQPATFDVVFLVAVLGEVQDPKECLRSISRTLRPGGLLSITELAGDPDAVPEEELRNLVHGRALEFVESVRMRRGFIASFRCQEGDRIETAASNKRCRRRGPVRT
jgi:ubiquinone/menaquinone biosynthesis C-methylase UbiE